MIPDECKMPDLSDLDWPLRRHLLLLRTFVGEKGASPREALYRVNFVRIVDKAVREYQAARSAIIAQIEELKRPRGELKQGGISLPILDFTDYFENCINATARLLKQLERIKSESGSWTIKKEVRRTIEAYSRAIPNIRDAVEHMDEHIRDDKLQEGQSVALSIGGNGDRAVLEGYEIGFHDLAFALRRLHEVALALLDIKPSN